MKVQNAMEGKTDDVIRYSSKSYKTIDYRDRRQQEMKRRFGILQSRRIYLESELKGVNNCLHILEQQIQSYSTFKQYLF